MARGWTQEQVWQQLNPYQRAAAMALLEADGRDPVAARNVLGAIINRSEKTGDPLGEHVSKPIYQPTIEASQFQRLPSILQTPQFQELTGLAEQRATGKAGDWVNGATHFLASEKTMLDLHRQNPDKYHNWGPLPNSRGIPGQNWTGFDPAKGDYKGVIMRDASHAFLAPEGPHGGAPKGGGMLSGVLGPADAPAVGTAVAAAAPATAPAAGGLLSGLFGGSGGSAGGSSPAPATFADMLGEKQGGGGSPGSKSVIPEDEQMPALSMPRGQTQKPDMRRVLALLQSKKRLGT
jgi:hypothetical protein